MDIDDEKKLDSQIDDLRNKDQEFKGIDEIKDIIKEAINEAIKEHSKQKTNIINNICIKNKDEEEKVEEVVGKKNSLEKYIVMSFIVMLVLFAGFYEIFIRIDFNKEALNNEQIVDENIEEKTVMVTPVEEGIEDENIIDSLFAFAENDKEVIESDYDSFNIDLFIKEKISNILKSIKDKFSLIKSGIKYK